MRTLLLLLLALSGAPEMLRVETAHYVLLADAPEAEAKEFAAVLEAAWPEYRKFFGAEPELPPGGKMKVVFAGTKEAFVAALEADGQPVPESGGYYAPPTRTAYLWRQPTTYYTRCLLLHEAAHQFHYLSRTKNRYVPIGWYGEGIAEHLCRHRWDGEKIELGVVPLISLMDYAAKALAEMESGADLAPAGVSGDLSRPLSWALVGYLLSGKNGRRFQKLRDRFDGGRFDREALFAAFGPPKKLAADLTSWLRTGQEPWCQVYNQWEETAPGRIRGEAGPGIVSFCRPKGPATRLSAKLEIPEGDGWTGGLLLSSLAPDDYAVALVFSGKEVHVNRRQDGAWTRLLTAPCPAPGTPGLLLLEAERKEGRTTLRIEGAELGTFDLPGDALGLALQGGVARFRDVDWK